jgi:YHS domain-containing protein
MSPIRKPWWAALALSLPMAMLSAGCGETTEKPDTPLPPVVVPKPAAKTETPKVEPAKAEAPKVEPAKTEAPKVEPPKVDPPKVDPPKPAAPKAEVPKPEPAKVAAAPVKLSDDELATIRKLPKEDVDAAIKQAVCPVSGDHLGTMDMPVKVSAEGKTFFLCCKSCKKEVDLHPKDVLAKLAK